MMSELAVTNSICALTTVNDPVSLTVPAMTVSFPDCKEAADVTNGDIIKAVFPKCHVEEHISVLGSTSVLKNGIDVTIPNGDHTVFKLWFPTNWWNAPYEGGEIHE